MSGANDEFMTRNRAPRVRIRYKVDLNGVEKTLQLPFVTGVLADLSGRPAEPPPPLDERHFIDVELRNFDDLMRDIGPRVAFTVPNAMTGEGSLAIDLSFAAIDDFSPSAIADRLPWLQRLKAAGDAVGTAGARIDELDVKLRDQIGLILHHPSFQELESSWRGLRYLLENTETDDMQKIRVLNVSKTELARSLIKYQGTSWDQSPLFKKIYEEEYGQNGGEPYAILVGDFYFDQSKGDVALLGQLAQIAAAAHAPFLSAAGASLLGMDTWQELANPRDLSKIFTMNEYAGWRSLRESEDARYLALTLPRMLARLPHGSGANPVEGFDFKEDVSADDLHGYVWMNAAYALAVNINRAFKRYGWCARIQGIDGGGTVENLPVHGRPDGAITQVGPIETVISDRRAAELAEAGLMALAQRKYADFATFFSAVSLQRPLTYADEEATAHARVAAQLPYTLAVSRFVHYFKCIARDWASRFVFEDMSKRLNEWLAEYVDGDPAASSEITKAQRPLAAADIEVEDAASGSGHYAYRVSPQYQLGHAVSLRLRVHLPSEAGPPRHPGPASAGG